MSVTMTNMGHGDRVESVSIELCMLGLIGGDTEMIRESLSDAVAALRGARAQMTFSRDGFAYALLVKQLERVVIELERIECEQRDLVICPACGLPASPGHDFQTCDHHRREREEVEKK